MPRMWETLQQVRQFKTTCDCILTRNPTIVKSAAALSRPPALLVHKRLDTGEKPYKCTQCCAAFAFTYIELALDSLFKTRGKYFEEEEAMTGLPGSETKRCERYRL